ncbi:MAG: glycosyltransferase [Acetobacteraceae bacterium]
MSKIGIAVTTYNRSSMLQANLALLKHLTHSDMCLCVLVISDDGSTDDTVATLKKLGIDLVVAGTNRGVA